MVVAVRVTGDSLLDVSIDCSKEKAPSPNKDVNPGAGGGCALKDSFNNECNSFSRWLGAICAYSATWCLCKIDSG